VNVKRRFWLCKRGDVFYVKDALTKKLTSLQTTDATEAERLLAARVEAVLQPSINLNIARTYLAAADPNAATRTWQNVMDAFTARSGRDSTKTRRERGARSKTFNAIRHKNLIETRSDDLRAVLDDRKHSTNHFLRCWHNLAVGLGWLPWAIIPPKLWPKPEGKAKRAITELEHGQIITAEQNVERRHYYELLWHLGAAQSDAAELTADSIDWRERTLSFQRKKTGELCSMVIGEQLQAVLLQLPSKGPLFPLIAKVPDKWRSAEFRRRCRSLRIEGVTLHSYRYAWAERAKIAGMPERFAQQALGHSSKAVARAYAKKASVKVPSLEEYESKLVH
jgi:integrase